MPRVARLKSNTDIYHIMCRGLNRELLFNEDGDYLRFLELINKAKNRFNFKLYAYCLMINHVHMILKAPFDDLSRMMRWLNSSYALFFNAKYGRLGYVFADRFRSENIENEDYFYKCIRYVHQNPVKARICKSIKKYKYSSIHAYIKDKSNYLELVDFRPILKKFDRNEFIKYNEMKNHDLCMDFYCNHYDDNELKQILFNVLKVSKLQEYDKLSDASKAYGALKLIDMYVPLRQISRVTGVYYNRLQKLRLGVEGKVASLTYTN